MQDRIQKTIAGLERLMQYDPGHRGIQRIPHDNLCSWTSDHLYGAVRDILGNEDDARVGILTGFYIPDGAPPGPENDGPPGALAIGRALSHLGKRVFFIADPYCQQLMAAGIDFYKDDLSDAKLIMYSERGGIDLSRFRVKYPEITELDYLISIERPGPSYSESFIPEARTSRAITPSARHSNGECLNMAAKPVTSYAAGTQHIFDIIEAHQLPVVTIGIGDGGNEIGMGAIPRDVIHRNITSGPGGVIACRIATDYTVVSGVSNWAGYAMAAALLLAAGEKNDFKRLCDKERETTFLQMLMERELAVDGVRRIPSMSVDGIDWSHHLACLERLGAALEDNS
jgi:hypothetical protein